MLDKKTQVTLIIAIVVGLFVALLTGSMILGFAIGYLIYGPFRRMRFMKMGSLNNGPVAGMNKIKIDKKAKWSLGVAVAFFIVFMYTFRPWFHDFLMSFYKTPLLAFSLLLVIAGSLFIVTRKKNLGVLMMGLGFAAIFLVAFNTLIIQNYIVQDTQYNMIDSLPDSSTVRMLPMPIAQRYLQDSLQKSRERIGSMDVVNINGTLTWTAPRVPDGSILYFTEKVNGIMTAKADTTTRQTELVTQKLEFGEEVGIFDSIYWRIYKQKFFVDIGEIFYLTQGEDIVTVVSLIGYKFKFPVMIPYFKGVMTVKPDGSTNYMTAQEAINDPLFAGNVIYPDSLARFYVDSYKYNKGVVNTWFLHEDQIEISDVWGEANKQPFLIPTDAGLKWVIATEPYGESYGVFKIFLIDALTGQIDLMELDEAQTLTGPVRVVSYVKQEFPIIDWDTSRVIEPRPYFVDGKLYWMLSITPRDYAGVSYTVFVDAETNKVIPFKTDEEANNFILNGEKAIEVPEEDEESDTGNVSSSVFDKITEIENALDELKKMIGDSYEETGSAAN